MCAMQLDENSDIFLFLLVSDPLSKPTFLTVDLTVEIRRHWPTCMSTVRVTRRIDGRWCLPTIFPDGSDGEEWV